MCKIRTMEKTFYLELYRRAYCVTYTCIKASSKEEACRIATGKYNDVVQISIDGSPRMLAKDIVKHDDDELF